LIASIRRTPALQAVGLAACVLAGEWGRALVQRDPELSIAALGLGGAALILTAAGWQPARLGLGTSQLPLRILGGFALAAVLLLPAAVRVGGGPLLPAGLAAAAVAVSIGEEVAFRGALYAAFEDLGGARLAVAGTTVLWTAAHALSHPAEFLPAVAAAGLLLGVWRWACRDLVAPIIGHVIADLAL